MVRSSRITISLDALRELNSLCHQGRVYDIERWIEAGKPLQIDPAVDIRRLPTALEIALKTGQHSLCELLLRNGYDPDIEPRSPFDVAIRARRWDLVDLLFEYRTNPHTVDLTTLFDSYTLQMFDRFYDSGLDFSQDHSLATAISDHPGNKPLFGFVKRRRHEAPRIQRELDMALSCLVRRGSEKGTLLCLWAGANPHARVPDLVYGSDDDPDEECETAVEVAAHHGRVDALRRFRPDPARVDFDGLYANALNGAVVELLAEIRRPQDVGGIIHRLCFRAGCYWPENDDWAGAVVGVLDCGVPWEKAEEPVLAGVRRDLLKASNHRLRDILVTLMRPGVCSGPILHELTRTPTMQKRMLDMGLIKPRPKPVSKAERLRREVAKYSSYDRERLYEQVWSEPVLQVAESYNVSNVYLARVCRALRVPLPPRGYWAKVRNGQNVRRPRLPMLRL